MKKILGLLMVTLLIESFQVGQAQEPLTQKYTTVQGTVSFHFPAGWVVQEAYLGEVLIANDEEVFTLYENNYQFFPGQAMMALRMPEFFSEAFGDEPVTDLNEVGRSLTDGYVEEIDDMPFPTVIVRYDAPGRDSVMAIVEVADGTYVGFLLQTTLRSMLTYRPTFLEIIDSLEYTPLPEVKLGGEIVWQYRHSYSDDARGDDVFGRMYDLAVNSDDLIIVNDGRAAVNVFNANGDYLDEIPVELGEGERINDLAFGPDDTFWVLVEKDWAIVRAVHFTIDGTVLGELSVDFESWRVNEFQIDQDGNFYILYSGEDTLDDAIIRIWDPDGNFVRDIAPNSRVTPAPIEFAIGPDGLLYLYSMYDFAALDTDGNLVDDLSYPIPWMIDEFAYCSDDSMYIRVHDSGGGFYQFLGSIFAYDRDGTYRYQFPPTIDVLDSPDVVEWPDDAMAYFTTMGCLSSGDLVVADHNGEEVRLMRVTFP